MVDTETIILEGEKAIDRVINGPNEFNKNNYLVNFELLELDKINSTKTWGSAITTEIISSNLEENVSDVKGKRVKKKKEYVDVVQYDENDEKLKVAKIREIKEKSIRADLAHYEIPEKIKHRADAIYKYIVNCNRKNGVDLIKRSQYRKMLIYMCVDIAYKSWDDPMIPNQLCSILYMKKGDVKKCSSKFSALKSNFKKVETVVNPMNYFETYVRIFNDSENKKATLSDKTPMKIMEFCDELLMRNPYLKNDSPGTLYASIFYYFVYVMHGIGISAVLLREVTGNSNATDKQGLSAIKKAVENMKDF